MKDSTIGSKIVSFLRAVGVFFFWIAVWQVLYLLVNRDILVVSPYHAVRRLVALAATGGFWLSVLHTCIRVVCGFLLALAAGAVLAVLSFRFRLVYVLFKPLLGVIKATPVASFIILALIWLSTNRLPVFSAFLMVIPLIWANLYEGLRNVDRQLLEMAQVCEFGTVKKLRLIYLPALMPYIVSACSTGLGIAWKSNIAAEVIAHPQNSIGRQIHNSRIYLETVDLFAWTMAVIVLSIVLERLALVGLSRLQHRILRTGMRREAKS